MLNIHLQNKQIRVGVLASVCLGGHTELQGMVFTDGREAHLITGQYFTL